MRRVLSILFLLLTCLSLSAADNNPRVIKLRGFKGLWIQPVRPLDRGDVVRHYRLNEAGGEGTPFWYDVITTNYFTSNAAVPSGAGKFGGSADFNNGGMFNCFLDDHFGPTPGNTDFSYCGWVYFNTHAAGPVVMVAEASAKREYKLDSDGTNLRWQVSSNGSTWDSTVTSTVPITNSVWIFWSVYHDSVNNLIGISVNDETTVTTSHGTGVWSAPPDQLYLGISEASAVLDGRVDSLTFWKRVLSQDDIIQLWNGSAGLDYPFP